MRILLSASVLLAGLLPATSALAAGYVDIGNTRYRCPNSCQIVNYPSGRAIVRDSLGGRITIITLPNQGNRDIQE